MKKQLKKIEIINELYKSFKSFLLGYNIKTHKDSTDIISLYFGNKKVLVIDAKIDDKNEDGFLNHQARQSGDLFIFFDPNFRTLVKICSKKPYFKKTKNLFYNKIEKSKKYNKKLYELIVSFSPKSNKTLTQKKDNYSNFYDYEIRKFFAQAFKLNFDADKEFFIYDDDSINPRYKNGKIKKPKNNSKIQIIDESAFIVTSENGNEQYISIKPFSLYQVKNKYYFGLNEYVKVLKANKKESSLVSYGKDGKRVYKKYKQLPVSKELLKTKKYITIKPANKLVFTLKYNSKTKKYSLQDKNGNQLKLNHPDLLIRLL